jgi:hypothetical protein
MPYSRLPDTIKSWERIYANSGGETLERADFESGSNFKYESALRLRVLHNVKGIVSWNKETRWIKSLDIPKTLQTEAKEAVRRPHFAGLLEVVGRAAVGRPGREWPADDFIKAGCFGAFLSLLSLIERENAGKETGDSAVTYYDHTPPVAARTRFRQAQEQNFMTPTKSKNLTSDLFNLSLEDSPGTAESFEEPPSGQGSVAKYEQARVNVQDEQTVNQCLINLMLPIIWPLGISGNIDPQRRAFKFALGEYKGYEARVDGIVTSQTRRNDVVGILEVKKGHRTHEVRVQEIAQMVAFMRSSVEQGSDDSVVKRYEASVYFCFTLLI